MVMPEEVIAQYGISAEDNEYSAQFANEMYNAYKNGTISKPQVLEKIASKAKDKHQSAMIAMFVGYRMSEIE
jgi:propanediol dehydratase small subunit